MVFDRHDCAEQVSALVALVCPLERPRSVWRPFSHDAVDGVVRAILDNCSQIGLPLRR
jgi:hypothetical protein